MALIKCPKCDKQISSEAFKCPKCGFLLQVNVQNTNPEGVSECSTQEENDGNNRRSKVKNKKKSIISMIVAIMSVFAVVAVLFTFRATAKKIEVSNIDIGTWKFTRIENYLIAPSSLHPEFNLPREVFEAIVSSEQKNPFVAVLKDGENAEERTPRFVYVENGVGEVECFTGFSTLPEYAPIGYIQGTPMSVSDVKVKYKIDNYYDSSDEQLTSCSVKVEIDLKSKKTGILIVEIFNETTEVLTKNILIEVIDGKAEYNTGCHDLPYKSRGVTLSIKPKMFCEVDVVSQKDYVVEKEYTVEQSSDNAYSGEIEFSFPDQPDAYVIYKKVLKAGGVKAERNNEIFVGAFLKDGKIKITTYDSASNEIISMPEYEFEIIGCIKWSLLKKEID